MRRTRVLGYSVLVAVAVFVALALPTLRAMFGPGVVLAVYAAVAVAAGGFTYATLPRIAAWLTADVEDRPDVATGDDDGADERDEDADARDDDVDVDRELADAEVDREIEQLRDRA